MTRRVRALCVAPAFVAVAVLSCGPAGAADKTRVDEATKQVEQGAKQIGHGSVGSGVKQTAKGIGNTVVEGAKYTGQKLGEAGQAAGPEAKTAWERTKEGAVAFGGSVRDFFGSLFR